MFGFRKKKAVQPSITLWDADGGTLYDGRLTGLALPDDTVVCLSVKFFNDPEPCEIHRGAVRSRVFAELEAALAPGAVVDVGDLGEMRAYFAAYPAARRVRVTAG